MLFVNNPNCIDISQNTLTINFDKFLNKVSDLVPVKGNM